MAGLSLENIAAAMTPAAHRGKPYPAAHRGKPYPAEHRGKPYPAAAARLCPRE
ncbi:MAG TPA: hypothetical protein VNI79_00920 [Sphingomicrobium sp.]|nr:hypothetical protein [Sphingomicrobium sp.]